jgi:membrane protease YdiL (CAAX protease family)
VVVLLAAAATLAVSLAAAWLEARRPLPPHEVTRRALRSVGPTDPVWSGVALVAGFVEEFAYRGVLTALLTAPLGILPAALVSAATFGLAHLAAGWRAVGFSMAFALGMQGLVVLSGGLAVAMVVHATHDLSATWLARHRRG